MKIHFDTDDISTRSVAKWLLLLALGVLIYHLGFLCGMHHAERHCARGHKCTTHFNMQAPSPMRGFQAVSGVRGQMMVGRNVTYGAAIANPMMGASAGSIRVSAMPSQGVRVIKTDDQGHQNVFFYRAQ